MHSEEWLYGPGPRPIRLSASQFLQVRATIEGAGLRLDDFFVVRLEFAEEAEPDAPPVSVLLLPRA